MINNKMFVQLIISLIFIFSLEKNYINALTQPTLKNLVKDIPVDYDVISFEPSSNGSGLKWEHLIGNYVSTGRNYSAYYAKFAANYLAFYPSAKNGCVELVKPSISSKENCEYATNGAFFTWDLTTTGSFCLGNLISDGNIWQLPTDGSGTNRANIGLLPSNEVMIGYFDEATITSTKFDQLITGWGWLVRDGVSYVDNSTDLGKTPYSPTGFVNEKAPRTAIGIHSDGNMVLLEIDGEEDILEGPDLYEVAELLVSQGVVNAINVDGGGSSVSVSDGTVIDYPTCNDTPISCERAVANFLCVKRSL